MTGRAVGAGGPEPASLAPNDSDDVIAKMRSGLAARHSNSERGHADHSNRRAVAAA